MASTDWGTIQGKKGRGIGNVTDDEKNAIIDREWHKEDVGGYFDPNYDRAIQALTMRDARLKAPQSW